MRIRHLMAGLVAAGMVGLAANPGLAKPVQIAVSTNPSSYGVAEIRVDGPSADGVYTEIRNETLDYIVSARGDRPKKATGDGRLEIHFLKSSPLSGETWEKYVSIDGDLAKDWKSYKVSIPYVDPWSSQIANERISPIAVCNENLKIRKKDARKDEMLKQGLSFLQHDAYKLRGYVEYRTKGSAAFGKDIKSGEDVIAVPVKITCMPLDRPRPKTQTTTRGVDPKPGQKMKPTIAEVSLRVEPAKIEKMGDYLCPTQLRLYGHLETIRAFTGKSIFMGPYYLSPISEIGMTKAGHRNVTGTYLMDWQKKGGLTAAPAAAPKAQSLAFRFNVSNAEGKVLESVETSIQVSCRKIEVVAPTAGNGLTVAPAD